MKYAALSSVLYHLARLSKPSIRASCTMLYQGVAAMFSHVLIKNSRTGIVHQTVGSHELENVWVVLAGSYREKWLVNAENIMRQLHTWRTSFICFICSQSLWSSRKSAYCLPFRDGTSSLSSASSVAVARLSSARLMLDNPNRDEPSRASCFELSSNRLEPGSSCRYSFLIWEVSPYWVGCPWFRWDSFLVC